MGKLKAVAIGGAMLCSAVAITYMINSGYDISQPESAAHSPISTTPSISSVDEMTASPAQAPQANNSTSTDKPTPVEAEIAAKSEVQAVKTTHFVELVRFLHSSNRSVSKGILNAIRLGEFEANDLLDNQQLDFTPLVAALTLDSHITEDTVREFIAEGADASASSGLHQAIASLDSQDTLQILDVLSESGYNAAQQVDGNSLAEHAFMQGNKTLLTWLKKQDIHLGPTVTMLEKNSDGKLQRFEMPVEEFAKRSPRYQQQLDSY